MGYVFFLWKRYRDEIKKKKTEQLIIVLAVESYVDHVVLIKNVPLWTFVSSVLT